MRNIRNFGRNVRFRPRWFYRPTSEQEVLKILAKHRGRRIRVVGRLHSWSDAARGEDVLFDLRELNQVVVEPHDDEFTATVGAGCQIKRLLAELARHGATVPSMGLITEQSIAGAVSTGTHGSGKHSLSHYVQAVRVATYDPQSGEPVIRTIDAGDELRAARCSLGCLGVILSVTLRCRPAYMIEEQLRDCGDDLDEVLRAEDAFPLQQFYLIPWAWRYLAQHRREVDAPRSGLAWLYRAYWFVVIDLALHLGVQAVAKLAYSAWEARFFYRRVVPRFVIHRWKVVDRSEKMLVMEHEMFRHIEIELFVPRPQLKAALAFVTEALRSFAGELVGPGELTRRLHDCPDLFQQLRDVVGTYVHHYPICVRRVLPDDTLISPASGDGEDWYAISIISYARPSRRAGFFACAEFLAASMSRLFSARPHWGKVCPLDAATIAELYPRLESFRSVCRDCDPEGVFRNHWTEQVLFTVRR